MDNYTFKTVAFGGFDKQDVIRYIEQASKESTADREKLQQERDSLQTEAESLRSQVRELQTRLEAESALREQAQSQLEEAQAARRELESSKGEAERLRAEASELEISCRESGDTRFYYLINFSGKEQPVPKSLAGKTDLITGVPSAAEDVLMPWDVKILAEAL